MTSRYRNNRNTILQPEFHGAMYLTNAETFDRSQIEMLFTNTQCFGLRAYYGMDDELKIHTLLVGTDDNGNDILPKDKLTDIAEEGFIIEHAARCPPNCDEEESPLSP